LLATIRDGGGCPCHRCLIRKSDIQYLGLHRDLQVRTQSERKFSLRWEYAVNKSRKLIYERGKKISSTAVEALLKTESLVPVLVRKRPYSEQPFTINRLQNTFQVKLGKFGFNISKALVCDVLHESEIGEIKTLITHLIRMLYSFAGDSVLEMNAR
jgi:hypothetical protein